MDRAEAVALLDELISLHLVQPSLILIEKNSNGSFSLVMKVDGDLKGLRQFVAEKKFAMEEDERKGYLTIFEP
ncbi:MAG TPA: hypothetical protein VK536_00495 [Candidatus Limnocylindrales bacterium]|nr:hypothetical protein [Candidatus Limnocylindrales bacterium]